MPKTETIEQFIARGGQVQVCETRGIRKYSSFPGTQLPKKVEKKGVDAQELLDAAVGTDLEADTIAFLESQGYEVN